MFNTGKKWTVKVLKIGHINLGRGWGWDCSILGIYYYLIKFIYILITWDKVMLVQVILYNFLIIILKFSINLKKQVQCSNQSEESLGEFYQSLRGGSALIFVRTQF